MHMWCMATSHSTGAAAIALGEVDDHDPFASRHADAHGGVIRRQVRMRRSIRARIEFVERRAVRQPDEIES